MNLSEEELYELTSSSAHSLNNIAMNMITLGSMMDMELAVDDVFNIRQGIISTGEKVIYISSAFTLLALIHEAAVQENIAINNETLNAQDFDLALQSIENYFEDVFEYEIDIGESTCKSIDLETLKYAILNAISYLRFCRQGHKLRIVICKIDPGADGIRCIVSFKNLDNDDNTGSSSKKNCNLIALQAFDKCRPCYKFVLDSSDSCIELNF